MEMETRTDRVKRLVREWVPRIIEAVLTYCEDRDRELLVGDIITVIRGIRERSAMTNTAEPT